MHPSIPTIVAFTQYACGVYLFRAPVLTESVVPLSLLNVMIAIALLLGNFRLYPKDLRKLFPCADHFTQYLINVFIFEHIIACAWLPLEAKLTEIIPTIGVFLDDIIQQFDGDCDVFCEMLQSEYIKVLTSCLFSNFILICVLHATKVIDLRLLECGVTFFITDISYRGRRRWKRVRRSLTKGSSKKSTPCCGNNNNDD